MDREELIQQFTLNYDVLKLNLKDISDEESLIVPKPAGNCLNWVVGHIAASRNHILKLVSGGSVLDADDTRQYERGAEVRDVKTLLPMSVISRAFDESQEKLKAALQQISDNDLNKPIENEAEKAKTTLGSQLNFLYFHEVYHLGQLGILRRIVGKDGAIR